MARREKVFLVLHHEIMMRGPGICFADDVVFHTASSLSKALNYIKNAFVDEYSWWEIQAQVVDGMEDPVHVGWYGRRGGKLKSAPFEKAVIAYKKCKADPDHPLNM